MGQKIGNIEQWRLLKEGERAEFPGGLRTVAIEVNAPEAINLYILVFEEGVQDAVEERFLARVEGRDRIEFTVPGDFFLFSDGGELWFFTTDDDNEVNVEVAPIVFTRIANRKDRNPNLEAIEWRMRQNVDARMRQLTQEAERRLADVERTYAARRHIVTPPDLVGGDQVEQAEQPPANPPAKAGKDADKGGTGGKPTPPKNKTPEPADD